MLLLLLLRFIGRTIIICLNNLSPEMVSCVHSYRMRQDVSVRLAVYLIHVCAQHSYVFVFFVFFKKSAPNVSQDSTRGVCVRRSHGCTTSHLDVVCPGGSELMADSRQVLVTTGFVVREPSLCSVSRAAGGGRVLRWVAQWGTTSQQ